MLHILLATIMSVAPLSSAQTSPSQLAFAATRSFGLHACDPAVAPPSDSFVFCASVFARNRTHRAFGDMIQGCLQAGLKHRVNGPPLDPDTELSFLVTRGTVNDLACELSSILEVVVTPEADVAPLILKQIHWRGILRNSPDQPLKAEHGTQVILRVDFENNTLTLARVVDETK